MSEELKEAVCCSFCGKEKREIGQLFAAGDSLDERGERVAICTSCITDLHAMITRKDPPPDDSKTH